MVNSFLSNSANIHCYTKKLFFYSAVVVFILTTFSIPFIIRGKVYGEYYQIDINVIDINGKSLVGTYSGILKYYDLSDL